MTGIYGINYSNNYSLTGNYGYGYSTGAVSSAQPEEKGMVVNPGKSDVDKAAQNNGKVLSATVSLRTAVCPECGTVYTAGGTTTTKISYRDESNPYQQNKKSADAAMLIGRNLDLSA